MLKKLLGLPGQLKLALIFIILMVIIDFSSSLLSITVDGLLGAVVLYIILYAKKDVEK